MARPKNRLQAARAGGQPNYTRVSNNNGTANNQAVQWTYCAQRDKTKKS